MENLGSMLIGLVIGVLLTAPAVWLLLRATGGGDAGEEALERLRGEAEQAKADEARARADADRARVEAAQARAELADARTHAALADARVAEARAEAALARQEVAEARAAQADAQADGAALGARVVAAEAQKDAAVARAAELAADRDQLVKEFKLLSTQSLEEQGKRADATAEQRLRATEQLLAPVRESLERFNERLGDVEKERVAMTTDLRNQVQSVRLTGEELRRETAALATALRKPQVRGAWGELQLKRVAEVAGMLEHCDFVTQETTTSSDDRTIRPDMKVTLAEGKYVYVDSKVPLASFLDAQETADDRVREERLASFARNVRTHIDQLSGKSYFKADAGTPEFVVLFLPSEALAAEALSQLPDLHEYAARRSIVLATPTTLIAMLRAIHYSWRQASLAESAAEVFTLGRELYDRLITLGGHFDKIGRALGSTVKAYNTALGSMEGRVMVTARRFRDLQVSDKELAVLRACEEVARQVTAPELIEDAALATPLIGRDRAAELPERAELVRGEPELDELVAPEVATVTAVTLSRQAR